MLRTKNVKQIAEFIADVLKSDREGIIVVDGDKGEGKSVLMAQICAATAPLTGTTFSFKDNMTWQRKELKAWIDPGDEQKPEMSCIIADEIVSMFLAREWFDADQIDAIKLLNMCRDRHLLVCGALPNFWELDKAFRSQVRYWIHVERRGVGWMFEKSHNPGARDKWMQREIEKAYVKHGNPSKAPNFVCRVLWDDWDKWTKARYLRIRNTKRVGVENQRRVPVRIREVTAQRDRLIRFAIEKRIANTVQIATLVGVDRSVVTKIVYNGGASVRV